MARTIDELHREIERIRLRPAILGLVPTMGALHEGHLSLVRQSQRECDATIVTIFVNPTQFAANEDLDQYPRNLDNDLSLLSQTGEVLVFAPERSEIYPPNFSTFVVPPEVAGPLEGERRPTHFRGVATVVLKLLNLTMVDRAYFGQKDYQQSLVVKNMVRDLNLSVDIRVCPIVRDQDGLALSSRNAYLSPVARASALSLNRCLSRAASRIEGGEVDAHVIMAEMTQTMIDAGVTEVEYAVVADCQTLQVVDTIKDSIVLLVAARVGETRLIDNWIVAPHES